MDKGQLQPNSRKVLFIGRLYGLLAPRAYSVIMFGALACTLVVKFFHSYRSSLMGEYFGWILTDIALLLSIEAVLAITCFRWPKRWIIRTATIIAAVVCTWSVMNAGWLIRNGMQILPRNLLPLVREPLSSLGIIGVNLAKMRLAGVILLGPSAVALAFFFSVLARPKAPNYSRRLFRVRIIGSFIIVAIGLFVRVGIGRGGSMPAGSVGLRYNSQAKAITSLFTRRVRPSEATRRIPTFDQMEISVSPLSHAVNHNVVIVVLEGVQYAHTSLAQSESELTPYLRTLAQQGVEFSKMRSSMPHTTKALFALLTGRYPSGSQDLAEAVPVSKPYAALVTILKRELNFRTAFFQSAKGSFEGRPGLVANLGFEQYHAREDLDDDDSFVGYLGCDEFAMIEPIAKWIKRDDRPFLLTFLCSVTHDPYEIPERFGVQANELLDRYKQAISYTDKFIAALDHEVAKLSPREETIFCVVGDHGEAFGEHGLFGHERIAFEEALRVPWVMRAESLIKPATRITKSVSSVDVTLTVLGLHGFDVRSAHFDGTDVLRPDAGNRRAYFSCWMQEGPLGFVAGSRKFIYDSTTRSVSVYELDVDALELSPQTLSQERSEKIKGQILRWRQGTIFRPEQESVGEKVLFGRWKCRWWNNRNRAPVAKAEYSPENGN